MASYRFQKWYFDLVTDNGEYIFGYFVLLFFKRFQRKGFTLVRAAPGATPIKITKELSGTILRNDAPFVQLEGKNWRFEITQTGAFIHVPLDDISLSFVTTGSVHGFDKMKPLTLTGFKGSALHWTPLLVHAPVKGGLNTVNKNIKFKCLPGYVDYVDSGIFPLFVPVRKLYWGRIYSPKLDVVYTLFFDAKNQIHANVIVKKRMEFTSFLIREWKFSKKSFAAL
ncbi:hypothetical protein JW935_00660 [candidate division KSB1 bacterium]|nr:hypothetical protein [candidate division KSB1 bacterium]